uniref:3-hydroxyacyl-CoA dehydrogenase NAD binding domain-containing protein n=1 Tax=Maylandia zebra TaxID=106582 RepID=A0A3P9BN10_9CICH
LQLSVMEPSVGIGAAVAVELVRLGMKVVGCDRDVGKLQVCSEITNLISEEKHLM